MPDMARPGFNTGNEVSDIGALFDLLERAAWHANGLCQDAGRGVMVPGTRRPVMAWLQPVSASMQLLSRP
jgi:hypothetical protein